MFLLLLLNLFYFLRCHAHTHTHIVQWSSRADFSNLVGEREVNEWNTFQGTMGASCRIAELTQGRRYFFRASCGNVKGWGQYQSSVPSSVIPSSNNFEI